MPKDTDGTNWMTVRFTLEVDVIADTVSEALYHAEMRIPDLDFSLYHAEVVGEEE